MTETRAISINTLYITEKCTFLTEWALGGYKEHEGQARVFLRDRNFSFCQKNV